MGMEDEGEEDTFPALRVYQVLSERRVQELRSSIAALPGSHDKYLASLLNMPAEEAIAMHLLELIRKKKCYSLRSEKATTRTA